MFQNSAKEKEVKVENKADGKISGERNMFDKKEEGVKKENKEEKEGGEKSGEKGEKQSLIFGTFGKNEANAFNFSDKKND